MWQVVWARTTESRGPILDTWKVPGILSSRWEGSYGLSTMISSRWEGSYGLSTMISSRWEGSYGLSTMISGRWEGIVWFEYHAWKQVGKWCHGSSTMATMISVTGPTSYAIMLIIPRSGMREYAAWGPIWMSSREYAWKRNGIRFKRFYL